MRRFYREVDVAAIPGGGFEIRLDGKPVRTPGRAVMALPGRPLAEAMAGEWAAQGETLQPSSMHLMQLAATCIDRVASQREAVIEQVSAYAGTDLLCYRAEHPADLVARQHAVWQPLLDWATVRFDAPLAVTAGIVPRPQDPAAIAAIRAAIAAEEDWRLTALQAATTALGSVVLGLALLHGRIGPEEAFAAAELDATWQIERWGEDPEATARRTALAEEIAAIARFTALL